MDDILFMNGHGIYVWIVYSVGTLLLSGSFIFLFYTPSELNKNNLPKERIKLGGMVKKGSIKYEDTKVLFVLTDFEEDLDIEFDGIPPDLFKEDSGAVMLGSFDGNGVFVAEEVFAKHDENYMPPELSK